MCACIFRYVHVCMYVCMCVCTIFCMYMDISLYMHILCMYVCVCMYLYECMYAMYICMCVCVCVYIIIGLRAYTVLCMHVFVNDYVFCKAYLSAQ